MYRALHAVRSADPGAVRFVADIVPFIAKCGMSYGPIRRLHRVSVGCWPCPWPRPAWLGAGMELGGVSLYTTSQNVSLRRMMRCLAAVCEQHDYDADSLFRTSVRSTVRKCCFVPIEGDRCRKILLDHIAGFTTIR